MAPEKSIAVTTRITADQNTKLERLANQKKTTIAKIMRELLLVELSKSSDSLSADPLLSEVIGIRILILNFLRPAPEGILPMKSERYEQILTECRRLKRELALQVQRGQYEKV